MVPSTHTPRKKHKITGFNLIEAAIVLGVVGLVIGGIWMAAAEVSSRQSASAALSDLTLGISKLDSYPMWQLAGYKASALTDIGTNLMALGVFDSTYQCDWITGCKTTKHPYIINVTSYWSWGSKYFTAAITAPSRAACTQLLTRMATLVQQRGASSDPTTANCIYNNSQRYAPNLAGAQVCMGTATPLATFDEAITSGCDTTRSFVVNLVR